MKRRSLLMLALAVFLFAQGASAGGGRGGQAGAFLRYGVGGRAAAMGGAFVAVADDPTAGYWNPAGLGQLREPQVGGVYGLLSLGRKYSAATAGCPLGIFGALGVNWLHLDAGRIEARDRNGFVTGAFSDAEDAVFLSCGKRINPFLAVGGGVKLLWHRLAGYRASGGGYDIGILLTPLGFLALGASAQNLQTRITWDTSARTRETVPRTDRMGLCLRPAPGIHLSADYEHIGGGGGRWHAGGEALIAGVLGLRAGADGGRWTAGAAVLAPFPRHTVEIDYSFADEPFAGRPSHRLAALIRFSRPASYNKPQK